MSLDFKSLSFTLKYMISNAGNDDEEEKWKIQARISAAVSIRSCNQHKAHICVDLKATIRNQLFQPEKIKTRIYHMIMFYYTRLDCGAIITNL